MAKIHLDTDIGGDMRRFMCARHDFKVARSRNPDALACAIALGWREGVEIETVPLRLEVRDTWLYEISDSKGISTRLVTRINGSAFNEYWCNILCR